MLSVVPIKQSSISSSYYLKQHDGYYLEDKNNKMLYQWFGKGAAELGLIGSINSVDHADVYSGKLPNGDVIGKPMTNGTLKGRPGYDLTFSMNKDLSLIICASKDKALSDYFLNAHINAVKTALTEVEKKVQARVSVNGVTQYQTTKNMLGSLCTHFSSRAGDAEVHTHALIANATKRLDGKWRALATDMSRNNGFFEMVRDNAVYFGSLYQNEMAHAAKEKGFEVERIHKNGMFKITGFPDDLRDFFSKRRAQIVDIVKTLHPNVQNNKKVYDQVAQHSKANKTTLNQVSFFEKAKNDVADYLEKNGGKNFDGVIQNCLEKAKTIKANNPTPSLSAIDAIKDAIATQSQFSVKLDANKIINQGMEFDLGHSTYGELLNAFNDTVTAKSLIPIENNRYTTASLIERENLLIKLVDVTRLSVITEPNSIKAKQLFLSDIIADFEKNNKKVRILTPNTSVSHQYNEQNKKPANTIFEKLKNIGKPDLAININSFLKEYESKVAIPLNNIFSKIGREVFIVDDAKRLDLITIQKLMELTQKRQANIVFLKNHEGRHNIFSGNALELIERCAVTKIDARSTYVEKAENSGSKTQAEVTLTSIPADQMQSKQSARHHAIATVFVEKYGNNMNNTIAISNSKKSAENLNHAIRETLLEKNKIGHDQYIIKTVEPLYLSDAEQKHAKFYPENTLIKTNVGRGVFRTQKIIGHDTKNNKIILQSEFGRRNLVSSDKIAKDIQSNTTNLYLEKNMAIAQGDEIRITQSNKQAKLLNLKSGESYKVAEIDGQYATFQSSASTRKNRIKIDKLNGLALNYNYAISANESMSHIGNKKEILCDLPAHAINTNLLADISKHTDKIHIVTDNTAIAEKKIRTSVVKQHAIDQEKIAPSLPKSPARLAIDYAISVVDSREAAFSLESVIEKALSYKLADNRLSDLHAEIRGLIKEKALHCRTDEHNNVVLGTHEAVITEQKIISQIASGKNQYEPLAQPDETRSLLKKTSLTPGQKNACELIASTKDRFVMIQGYAGTGKSTMLQTLIGDKTIDAITGILPKDTLITALAPTHQAVSELKNLGIEAQTLKSFLVDNQTIEAEFTNSKNKLIIVDESSMISNSDFYELQAIVEKQNARCVYLGDVAQLLAVEAGKPSELAYFSKEASIATATMQENQRQKNPDLKNVVQLLMNSGSNNFSNAFKLLDQQSKIVEIKGKETMPIAELATAYAQLKPDERAQTLIAAATNKNRTDINAKIHSQLKKQGELSGSTISFNILEDSRLTKTELLAAHNHKPGMVIKYQNEYKSVTHVDEKNKMLTLKDDKNNISFLSLNHLPENNFIEQYTLRSIDINIGEQIKFTKTNRDLNRLSNTTLIVGSIDHEKHLIKAKSREGKEHILDIHNRESQHIDYSYCSTTHGLQGATSKNIFVYLDSHNRFSNTMRQMYVAVTRAQENAVMYTDDKNRIKQQVINHEGEKASALEAMGLIEKKNFSPIHAKNTKSSQSSSTLNVIELLKQKEL